MTQKILALDLGQSSIGWLIRNTEYEGIEQFNKFGTWVFDKGVGEEKNNEYSLAAERTKYRSMRRLYQSRKYKLWETLKKLKAANLCPIQDNALLEWTTYNKNLGLKRQYPVWDNELEKWIKLDFNGDNKPDFESPYQLRKYLAENKIDFSDLSHHMMLGRAIYHIAQHRAFKSSKKVKVEEDEQDTTDIGAERKKKENLKKEFENIGLSFDENKTVGQLLAEAESFFKQRGYGRIRNELHPHVTRKMLQQEVEQLFKFQFGEQWLKEFEQIFGVSKVSKSCVFWQRPLRSQKSAVGKCTLEKNKYRCPVSHPEFEIFRAWAFINNLRYKSADIKEWTELPLPLKEKLYNEVFIKANDFNVGVIKKWLVKVLGDKTIIINYIDKTNVSGSPSIYYLNKLLGADWKNFKIDHPPIERIRYKKKIKTPSVKNYYNYEDIWHIIFQLDDEEDIEQIARDKFKFNDEQIKTYLTWFKNMPVDYARLSLKAISNINYFLKKGFIYTDAVLLAKIPDILGKEIYNQETENLLIKSLKDIIVVNRKNKLIINITNNLISEYKINHYHERDYDYKLQQDDLDKIAEACKHAFGEKTWESLDESTKNEYKTSVSNVFQSFFSDKKREYRRFPRLLDDLKNSLKKNFNFLDEKILDKLYHPSAIDIYPKLIDKDKAADGKLYLKSPRTGSWKNPMALKVLQELRKLINYLIKTDQIDEQTKIVVEIPRELNDANKRKAYQIWQKRREEENKQFAIAIAELLKNTPNDSEIDKFRLWYEQCFDEATKEFTDKGPNEFKLVKKKAKKDDNEEIIKVWKENQYEKIITSLWFEIQKAKDDVLTKYRLWQEQKATCIYTGKIISISDLFSEDTIDIEHTLPYSRSLDNSLENKTVCFKQYNRKEKQNKIPSECHNYEDILKRIKSWQEKIEAIKQHLVYWKNEAKRASTVERKNKCIVEKHLWTWELQYWNGKVERFLMKEIKDSFVNAQLVETQIISKYAIHYLKTLFEYVQVQKGEVTAEFSKILGVREKYKSKIRDKHTHHTVDALILSLLPSFGRLKIILEMKAEVDELSRFNEYADADLRNTNKRRIEFLNDEIQKIIKECRISKNAVYKAIQEIEQNTIVIHKSKDKDKIFATAKKKISKGKLKGKYAKGDLVRGQLHKESFYGKIKLVERDEYGKPKRNEKGEWIWKKDKNGNEEFAFVKRVEVDENLKIENIVDPLIKKLFEEKVKEKSLKEMKKEGGLIYTDPKTGKTIRIRHVRCFQKPTELLEIKKQTYASKHDYKNLYYADNAENLYYALYEDEKGNRTFEMLNLFNAIKIKQTHPITNPKDFFEPFKEVGRGKNKSKAALKAVLYPGQKVIFYKEKLEELKELSLSELSKRTYKIFSLYGKTTGQVQFQHHLEARADKDITDPNNPQKKLIGFSSIDFNNLQSRYLLSPSSFKFAIEEKDFEIKPDGELIWQF